MLQLIPYATLPISVLSANLDGCYSIPSSKLFIIIINSYCPNQNPCNTTWITFSWFGSNNCWRKSAGRPSSVDSQCFSLRPFLWNESGEIANIKRREDVWQELTSDSWIQVRKGGVVDGVRWEDWGGDSNRGFGMIGRGDKGLQMMESD